MERTPVSSSDIASIGYDEDLKMMEVEFHSGSIYLYYDVPESFFEDFMASPSKGQFMNLVVKRSGLAYERIA